MAYAYNAAMWCDDCATTIMRDLDAKGVEDTGDTDDYPQGDSSDGEADSPQHCDGCNAFLENPLTADGYAYVRETILEDCRTGRTDSVACTEWAPFYGIETDDIEAYFDRFTLSMSLADACGASHPGPCDDDVAALIARPDIAAQLDAIAPDDIRAELREYGFVTWDGDELGDDTANRARIVWIAAGNIREEYRGRR